MNNMSRILFTSGFYRISGFNSNGGPPFSHEYAHSFNLCFTDNPNISDNLQGGYIIIDKTGENRAADLFRFGQASCIVIDFTPGFLETIRTALLPWFHNFIENRGFRSLVVQASPEIRHSLSLMLQQIGKNNDARLSIDILVMELLEWLHENLGNPDAEAFHYKLHKNQLVAVEQAKDFIYKNFSRDFSLTDITTTCNIIPLYFSRIFKSITGFSLYQFLLDVRLKNAAYLVQHSNLHFGDICAQSGFTSAEHFDTAFRKKFGYSPSLHMEKIPFFKGNR